MGILGVLFSAVLLLSPSVFAGVNETCDFLVTKTMIPIDGANYHESLCLQDYFLKRNLAENSLGEDKLGLVYIFKDSENIVFDDMILFNVSQKSLGEAGRIALIRQMYANFLASLKNENGLCSLKLNGNNKALTIDDFIVSERNANDQPGTRLMLTKDDVASPSWELICPDADGKPSVIKSGNYFFVFFDLYENTGTAGLVDHLSQFLMGFR